MTRTMRADSTSGGVAKIRGNSARKNRSPCRANLIDDAGALSDQSLADAVQCLQIELFHSLRCHKLHGRALDSLCVAEVVLLPPLSTAVHTSLHQPSVVTQCLQLPTEMMRTNASFHAD